MANATAGWTASGTCTATDGPNWRAVPASPGTAAARVAIGASGVTNATANLRFGFAAAPSQATGEYVAPLEFEVVAPDA